MYFELKKNMQVILNKSGDYNYQKQSTKLLHWIYVKHFDPKRSNKISKNYKRCIFFKKWRRALIYKGCTNSPEDQRSSLITPIADSNLDSKATKSFLIRLKN